MSRRGDQKASQPCVFRGVAEKLHFQSVFQTEEEHTARWCPARSRPAGPALALTRAASSPQQAPELGDAVSARLPATQGSQMSGGPSQP